MAKPAPISRADFSKASKPLPIHFGNPGEPGTFTIYATPGDFATGSFGYKFNGKGNVLLGGNPIPVQIGLNVTVIGSKGAADAKPATKTDEATPEDKALADALAVAASQVS